MYVTIYRIKKKEVTGYKFVYLKDGEIYSTFTGQKYKIGVPVDKAPSKCEKIAGIRDIWNPMRIIESWKISTGFYYKNFDGLTSVFKSLKDLKDSFVIPPEYTIVKMTLTGDLYDGIYGPYPIYAGNIIKSFKVIK